MVPDNGFPEKGKRKKNGKKKEKLKRTAFPAPGAGLVKAEPIKILPMGWRFISANPKGRRALTRVLPGG